ncbi:hypothetical protein JZU46_00165 [bacterium]|nr:hypothetical protein [bacterium]
MEDKLKEQVEKLVTAIFASKEDETMRAKTTEALQASADKLEELKVVLTEKEDLLATAAVEVEALKAEATAVKEAKEVLEAEKSVEIASLAEAKLAAESALEKVSLELSTMKKEIIAEQRMQELTTAGVVREDASLQKAKIVEMTDEVFASYKDELVSIKTQVLAALKTKAAVVPVEEEKETIPAKIDSAQSAQAALNLESSPPQSLAAKYKELGEAMAANIKRKN